MEREKPPNHPTNPRSLGNGAQFWFDRGFAAGIEHERRDTEPAFDPGMNQIYHRG
jgi:hypothetical protein